MPHRAAVAVPEIMVVCTAGEAGRSKVDGPHHDGNANTPSDAGSDGKTAWKTAWKGTVTFSPVRFHPPSFSPSKLIQPWSMVTSYSLAWPRP